MGAKLGVPGTYAGLSGNASKRVELKGETGGESHWYFSNRPAQSFPDK
jgi:hypothetical protein